MAELEKAGPSVSGSDETYTTMFEYDELNRRTRTRVRGKTAAGPTYTIDHSSYVYYDSTGSVRLTQDANDKWSKSTHDDLGRSTMFQRYDSDPTTGTPTELYRSLTNYDDNSRVTKSTAYSDLTDLAGSKQETLYAYDDLNRRIRVVHPDSDDPIDGSGNGTDTVYDRIEYTFDANSNTTQVKDQRAVTIDYTYDAANRLTEAEGSLSVSFASKTRNFVYDSLNRMTEATNQQSKVTRSYDDLGRLTQEGQSIRLDGDVAAGFKHLVDANYTSYNLDSQLLSMNMSGNGGAEDLKVDTTYDSLHRKDEISARYFSTNYSHDIADYDYFGLGRLVKKTYGNDAFLTVGYDDKRRIDSYVTKNAETTPELLVGFEYAYDDVNNPLYSKWLHTRERKEIAPAILAERALPALPSRCNLPHLDRSAIWIDRGPALVGLASFAKATQGPSLSSLGVYDDVSNRISATDADPFGNVTATSDSYTINDANEYTQVNRDSTNQNPSHDAAHNMTAIPVRPGSGTEAGNNVSATAVYDTFGQMANIQAGSNDKHYYIYDALGRRIAALQIIDNDPDEDQIALGRRYLYDGSMVASEYIFKPETSEGETTYTTLENGYAELERIYVRGSILFCAIDHDQDSTLTNINDISECNWAGGLGTVCNDHAFYYYTNKYGEVAALGHKDDDQKVLEYYRSRYHGEPIVLPVVDDGVAGGSTADDGIEDTPDDLSDNNSLMMTNRGLNGDYVGRVSEYGNRMRSSVRYSEDGNGVDWNVRGEFTLPTIDSLFDAQKKCVDECYAQLLEKTAKHGPQLMDKSCEELCDEQTLGLKGEAPAIRYGASGVRAINEQEPKGRMPGAAAKRAGNTGGLAYPDFKNYTLNVALRGTPIVSLSTGCSVLCILQHELQHIEDMKDCADKAFARVRSGNETAASMERSWRENYLTDANRDYLECRGHNAGLKCAEAMFSKLGISIAKDRNENSFRDSFTSDSCDKPGLTAEQKACCLEMLEFWRDSISGRNKHCKYDKKAKTYGEPAKGECPWK